MASQYQKPLVVLRSTLSRLPLYYCYLKDRVGDGQQYISCSVLAAGLKLNPVLVRKDLAGISRFPGKPKLGFEIEPLLADLESCLGYNNVNEAVVVGIGSLGRTLLSYEGFQNYGFNLVAGFEINEDLIGIKFNGKPILSLSKLPSFLERTKVNIAIIAVPKQAAQDVCDLLLQAGVKAIWNFAPTHIEVPDGVLIKNENLAASLAILSNELAKALQEASNCNKQKK